MAEAVAFICGLFAMGFVWFVSDLDDNKYMKGYADGLRDGINEVMSDIEKIEQSSADRPSGK